MTDNLLKWYQNPAIQSKRGEWQVGDKAYFCGEKILIVNADDGIVGWYNYNDVYKTVSEKTPSLIWLPPLWSDEQPERCLWGMIDWNHLNCHVNGKGRVRLRKTDAYGQVLWGTPLTTPTEAVLKAIIAQRYIPQMWRDAFVDSGV